MRILFEKWISLFRASEFLKVFKIRFSKLLSRDLINLSTLPKQDNFYSPIFSRRKFNNFSTFHPRHFFCRNFSDISCMISFRVLFIFSYFPGPYLSLGFGYKLNMFTWRYWFNLLYSAILLVLFAYISFISAYISQQRISATISLQDEKAIIFFLFSWSMLMFWKARKEFYLIIKFADLSYSFMYNYFEKYFGGTK